MSVLNTPQKACHCKYPSIAHPGICWNCHLTHKDADAMRDRAIHIPVHLYEQNLLSWDEKETLVEVIDRIVWRTFNQIRHTTSALNLLEEFGESILKQVRFLLSSRHQLLLSEEDAYHLKYGALAARMAQLNLSD